jgi:hypothetical protein
MAIGGGMHGPEVEARASELMQQNPRLHPQSAMVKAYQQLAGETEARNVQMRKDATPAELLQNAPWRTQDVDYADQLLRSSEAPGALMELPERYAQPTGAEAPAPGLAPAPARRPPPPVIGAPMEPLPPPRIRPTPEQVRAGPEAPEIQPPSRARKQGTFGFQEEPLSFSERMAQAQDIARERANRGTATGNYGLGTARRTAPDAPRGSFEDLAAREAAKFKADQARIVDEYRVATGQPRRGESQPLLAPGERMEDFQLDVERLHPTGAVTRGVESVRDAPYALPAANANIPGMTRVRGPGQPPERIMDESSFRFPSRAEVLSGYTNTTANPLADLPRRGNVTGIRPDVAFQREEIGAPAVLRPDRPLFDLSPEALARSHIPREQFDIPRTAAETVTPEYEKATSKANIARVNREVAQGVKEHGLDWHAMGQLRDRYIAELGEKKGTAEFEKYMREVGATSPNSNVEQNFRTASYYAQQRRAGEPLPQISYKRSTGNPYLPPREAPPTPYGNTAQGLHVMNLGLLERGEPYPLSRPKVPSFTENMLGNYRPVAVDRHNLRMWGIDADAPNLTGYKHLERVQQGEAEKMGIHPAQYQAAPWPFYAKSGADPALKLFQNRVMHTAEAEGKTPAQVLRDFIRGTGKLLSVTPAAVLLGQSLDPSAPEPTR